MVFAVSIKQHDRMMVNARYTKLLKIRQMTDAAADSPFARIAEHVAFSRVGCDRKILEGLPKGSAANLLLHVIFQLLTVLLLVSKVDLAALRGSLLPHDAKQAFLVGALDSKSRR